MFPEHQSSYTSIPAERSQAGVAKKFVANVFLWMFGALAISALFAWLFANNAQLMAYLVDDTGLTGLGKLAMWAPLLFVIVMSFGYQRLSATAMAALFVVYAAVMGVSLSFILQAFTAGSVVSCFAAAAVMFGVMAVMGYTTDKDLTSFGRIMMMGLIGIVVASIINWWVGSAQMDWIISIVGVAVFTGLTAYDVQKIKHIGMGLEVTEEGPRVSESARKASVYGALTLYLDFINLFLMILRLFGRRR
jgi:FtsH-binding integral membrane protein